jgi:UDP-glucuronate decarboxylase
LGNPGEFTVLQLAGLVRDMTHSKSAFKFLPLPQDDPRRRQPDISRAKTLLNWSPKVPLRQGLMQTISYFTELEPSRSEDRISPIAANVRSASGRLQNLPA